MPFANSDNCNIYYEMHGETGTPVLLIAGFGTSIVCWKKPLLDELAAHHRVVIFDNRGVGQSDKPKKPYSMAQFADDTAAVLDAAGIEATHVMGTSMGGMIAQNFVVQHPTRVLGLVLGCTTPAGFARRGVVAPSKEVFERLLKSRRNDRAQDIRNTWPILHSPRFIKEHPDLLEADLQAILNYPASPQYALEAQIYAIEFTHDVRKNLGDIRQPTLVLAGTADVFIPPANSQYIAVHIPGAKLIEYPDAGHAFIEDAGQVAIDDIVAFFNRVDREL